MRPSRARTHHAHARRRWHRRCQSSNDSTLSQVFLTGGGSLIMDRLFLGSAAPDGHRMTARCPPARTSARRSARSADVCRRVEAHPGGVGEPAGHQPEERISRHPVCEWLDGEQDQPPHRQIETGRPDRVDTDARRLPHDARQCEGSRPRQAEPSPGPHEALPG